MGFVNYVVPKEQVMSKALELASKIAANGPVAVREIRKAVKENLSIPDVAGAMANEGRHAGIVFSHADAKEGPLAFAQKRAAVWADSKL